jgi:hypothetical protein
MSSQAERGAEIQRDPESQNPHNSSHTPAPPSENQNLSPTMMDQATYEQGKDIKELLRQFRLTVTTPLSGFILQTPQRNILDQNAEQNKEEGLWRSPRLKKKNSGGKTIVKLAQDLVVKKCGILQEEESLDVMTLQQYQNIYNQPLTDQSPKAIQKLTEVAVEMKNKKKMMTGKRAKSQSDSQEHQIKGQKKQKVAQDKQKKKKDKKKKKKEKRSRSLSRKEAKSSVARPLWHRQPLLLEARFEPFLSLEVVLCSSMDMLAATLFI